MYLNLIAQLAQLSVDVFLLGLRLLARPLEFNQQRATARNPENAVWVPGTARRDELGADDPEMLPNEVTGGLLDLGLSHPNPLRSATV